MAKRELRKHVPDERFTNKVVTLAQMLGASEGKRYEFRFANGLTVRTRVEHVLRDPGQVHLLLCGRTRVAYHSREPLPEEFESFILVPSSLAAVTELTPDALSFQVAHVASAGDTEIRTANDPLRYSPLPIISGRFERAPGTGTPDNPAFGMVRLGGKPRRYRYRDVAGVEHEWIAAPGDAYVSARQIAEYRMEDGDLLEATCRQKSGNERFGGIVRVLKINGKAARGRRLRR